MTKKLQNILAVLCVVVLWFALCVKMVKVWAEHPAEQTITRAEHMEMIEGWTR